MIDPANEVSLSINGSRYVGWTGVRIGAGIERVARDFNVSITREAEDAGQPGFFERVSPGDRVELRIGSDLVMTGHVDALPISYDDNSISRSITGRSLTADLVDCAAIYKGGQWIQRSLAQIARDLAGVYGVTVIDKGVSGLPVPEHQIDPGETVFESLDRVLQLRQALAFDDPSGRLVIDTIGTGKAVTALVRGENIKSCNADRDFKDCFSEYRVLGQRAGSDADYGGSTNQLQAVVRDSRVRRTRILQVKQSGQATLASCRDLARFERDRRAARPYEISYTVSGWRQGDGRLWAPNVRVLVWDDYLGLDGAEMLIAEVEYSYDDSGTVATLRVGPPDAYLPQPAEPQKRKAAKTGVETLP
ncbi:MAG: phage baseplate assembly protein [Pseudomonadota bacterium]